MKLFKFTSRQRVDAVASELAAEFSRLCPLSGMQSGRPLSDKYIERGLSEIYARAKTFRKENRLGIFKRARLAKIFQEELTKRGYDADLVGRVTTALVAVALSADR